MVATSHDVMLDIELYQPTDEANALALAASLGKDGWLLGGGQDTYGWLKDRNKTASAMIELTQVDAWKGIKETSDGIEIGAVTTLTEISKNPLVKEKFALLAKAAGVVASPQIRNVGTLAGNLAQDARCWYYRRGLDCYRAGGNICYADSPEGLNREHAIFGASRCVAVSPSDTAPALVALDATMVVTSAKGQRLVSAQDFALVSISAAMKVSNGVIEDSRIACGAVECVPRRLDDVENALRGQQRSEQLAEQVAAIASEGAEPLNYNHFKIPLIENLVKRAVRG